MSSPMRVSLTIWILQVNRPTPGGAWNRSLKDRKLRDRVGSENGMSEIFIGGTTTLFIFSSAITIHHPGRRFYSNCQLNISKIDTFGSLPQASMAHVPSRCPVRKATDLHSLEGFSGTRRLSLHLYQIVGALPRTSLHHLKEIHG